MTDFARQVDGLWDEIVGDFVDKSGDEPVMRSPQWLAQATADDLAAAGVAEIVETDEPADAIIIGSTIVDVDGVPKRQWTSSPVPLTDVKADLKRQAETIRDGHINGGCETPHGRVDTDQESRINISGSVQMAAILGSAFTTSWRRADNTYVTLDDAAMIAVGIAAGQHVATCYGACFAIKDAIDAATTRAAAREINREAGYPA